MRAPVSVSTIFAAGLAAGLAAACSGGSHNANPPDAAYDCSTETRADTFTAGMSKAGAQGMLTFKLMSSTPAPPSRGDNTWQIDVVKTSDGTAVAGATVTLLPFMPDHNHGTSIKATVTEPSAGHYQATPVNLWMPGFWTVTVTATPSGGTADHAVFAFCIPG